jgi:geranylgeranyl reductase family protein
MIRVRVQPAFDCDIAIAGAGPAGASAAVHLARAGRRVVLLDRQVFPRDKVCGDFVGPVALIELARLGVTARAEYRQTNVIHRAALYLNGKKLITSLIPQVDDLPSYGRVVPRALLDAWILETARASGVEVLEGERVGAYEADASGVTVNTAGPVGKRTLRARLLLGADGSGSSISRRLRGRLPRDQDRIIAVRAYYQDVAAPDDCADLFFSGESFPGYYWLFPAGGGRANVGIGMVLDTMPPTDDHLRDLLVRLVESDPALKRRVGGAVRSGKIVGWPLDTYNPRLPIVGNRVLLLGDAAGLINPLNGEGIQYALLSGRWAAETALAATFEDDFSPAALTPYVRRVEEELRLDMALSGLVVQLIRNRSLNPIWLAVLRIIVARARVDPAYAAVTGGVLAGIVPASRVLSFKVVRDTVEQVILSLGFEVGWSLLRGSAHWAELGREAGRTGLEMAGSTLSDPVAVARWGFGVAAGAVELAVEVAKHLAMPRPAAAAPPPAAPLLRLSVTR